MVAVFGPVEVGLKLISMMVYVLGFSIPFVAKVMGSFNTTVVVTVNCVAFDETTMLVEGKTKLELPVFFKTNDLANLFPFGTVPKSVKSVVEGVVSPFAITVLFPLTSNTCE